MWALDLQEYFIPRHLTFLKTIDLHRHFINVSSLEIGFLRHLISKQFAGYQLSVDQLKEIEFLISNV